MAVPDDFLLGRVIATNVVDPATGELAGARQRRDHRGPARQAAPGRRHRPDTLYINDLDRGGYISQTLRIDETADQWAAKVDLPHDASGRAATEDAVEAFQGLFYAEERYDLSVGRSHEVQPPRLPEKIDDKAPGWRALLPARRRAGRGRPGRAGQ